MDLGWPRSQFAPLRAVNRTLLTSWNYSGHRPRSEHVRENLRLRRRSFSLPLVSFQPFREPDASERRGVGRALAGKFSQHTLHRRRQAHIKLCRIVLENRIPQNLIQVAVILDDLRDTGFETIKHIAGFRAADNLSIRCVTAKAGNFSLSFSFPKPILAIAVSAANRRPIVKLKGRDTPQVRIKQ
jgi:hypothetical protein